MHFDCNYYLKKIFLTLSFSALYVCWTYGAEPIQVTPKIQSLFIESKHIDVFVDHSNKLSIHDILNPKNQVKFHKTTGVMPYLHHTEASQWIKMSFEGNALIQNNWIIENLVSQTNYLEAYYINDKNEVVRFKPTGVFRPFETRAIFWKNFAFELPHQEEIDFYFKINSRLAVHGAFELKSQSYFIQRSSKEEVLLTVFYSFIFITIFINFLIYLQYRDTTLIKYILFGLSTMLFCTADDSLGFQYLWNDWPKLNYFILYFSSIVFIACLIEYVRYFAKISFNNRLFQTTLLVFGIGVLKYLFDLYTSSSQENIPLYFLAVPLLNITVYRKREKNNAFLFFLIGLTLISIGVTIFVCRRNMLIDINWSPPLLFYFLNIVLLVMCLLFSMSIALRTRARTQAEIGRRKDAEVALQLKYDELSQVHEEMKTHIKSNNELEQFAHTVSHDLKQPVRNINSFSKLLEQNLKSKNQLDSTQQEFLHFIIDSTDNMQSLINGLLEYAKIGGMNDQVKSISIADILIIIQNNLRQQIKESNAKIIIGNLPEEMFGVQAKIIQLFQNMISNAIKFRKMEENCIIQISATEKDAVWKFKIQDNGLGIPNNQKDKVFEIFSRAHQDKKIKGSGIGLATCQRIVQQHGGKIWVDPDFEEGTIFYFTMHQHMAESPNINHRASTHLTNNIEDSSLPQSTS